MDTRKSTRWKTHKGTDGAVATRATKYIPTFFFQPARNHEQDV